MQTKHILLIGAGKSATVLISFLKKTAENRQWQVTVADADLQLAQSKTGVSDFIKAVRLDIQDEAARAALIQDADVVISMMPPALHYLVATDCIRFRKHLLTASYVDEKIRALAAEIAGNNLLFLCEMGLDPGIDHMSAMQLIHRIKAAGGKIRSFLSHCGGLVSPESDNNPWHYKISWNPRNVVLAGKAGAVYKKDGAEEQKAYEDIFRNCGEVATGLTGQLAYYPNRDSLSYMPVYGLEDAATFMRTTLRYPNFCRGWQLIVELKLTDETEQYELNGISVKEFLRLHLHRQQLSFSFSELDTDETLKQQFSFLGLNSDEILPLTKASAADVMQYLLEKKLVLEPHDKDLIVMLHEIGYELNGAAHQVESSLVVAGNDALHTAMAKTVGLPLGIAAVLLLDDKITLRGLHIPILPEIYEPVLEKLAEEGIAFTEKEY
ncbi:saccharopine dehydrogenase C-terminal domain-containing protein [Sediminibacterium ginsengisoli]|uniref:Saccharopine dehydrogenase (NADP+, L-glutamate forming) n=1 Tax=Sediminibacterium ginsengisoli TaxID=413434 RepID=A0A1T4PT43_9BACT|nr:saccharopine dehydrogenase C-terminal domain-containing protein [Sediminibacterium ginsengisoli]SJZ94407.1 saccharopine dehydrogenase (NADP+, L-glutamate forming) [Sediminibacterium ginsengisoli]